MLAPGGGLVTEMVNETAQSDSSNLWRLLWWREPLPKSWRQVAWLVLIATLYSIPSLVLFAGWRDGAWDMGIFVHFLWLIGHGDWLARSSLLHQNPAIADAGSFVLYPLALWYRITGPYGILWLQSLALVSALPFLWRWGEEWGISVDARVLVSVAYLSAPVVLGPLLFDFHPDVLGIPILCVAIDGLLHERWRWYWVAVGASLLVKDTMPFAIVGLGVCLIQRRQTRRGLITVGVGAAWLFLISLVIIPALSYDHGISQWATTYAWMGATPLEALKHLLTDPKLWLVPWQARPAWQYVAAVVAPTGVVALMRCRPTGFIWPVATALWPNIYSTFRGQHLAWNQYSLFAVPFLFAMMLAALQDTGWLLKRALPITMIVGMCAAGLGTWLEEGYPPVPLPPAAALSAAVHTIPAEAPVIAQNATIAYLANRPIVDWMRRPPFDTTPGTYVLIDMHKVISPITPRRILLSALHYLLHSPHWSLVFQHDAVYVFRRLGRAPPARR